MWCCSLIGAMAERWGCHGRENRTGTSTRQPGRYVPKKLQRDVPVLLAWVFIALGVQHFQCLDQLLTRVARTDYGIHETTLSRNIRIGETVAELFDLRRTIGSVIL